MKINGIFKLLPNLNDKNNYILHYKETLRQPAHHGLKICFEAKFILGPSPIL